MLSLKNQVVVFTGALVTMTRKEAKNVVLSLRGHVANHVSKSTTILVIGNYSKSLFDEDFLTKKERLAQTYMIEGYLIELISEKTFLEIVINDFTSRNNSVI